ncbi:MAG: 4'-phosphopantetheinyl transferase superfamily protein [Myxococcales bacterium]|nr:4'-phosphopantetheinyl transferase superfamily protein [Myxococcales bacterium]
MADRAQLEALFPAAAVLVVADAWMWEGFDQLFDEERALGERAVQKRRRELAAGRHAARAALEQLGYAPAPIARGTHGMPQWPAGACGSITHCKGFAGAVVAHAREVRSLGFDAEQAEPLKPQLIDLILSASERAALGPQPRRTDWGKVAFSCKEAFYKAYYPHARQVIDFLQVHIELTSGADAGEFRIELVDDAVPSAAGLRRFEGRWLCDGDRVYSACAVL